MRQQLEQRLQQLKAEYESGQKVLVELETKAANVRESLLRISGAIQVLEEELNQEKDNHSAPLETVDAVSSIPVGEPPSRA